MQWRSDKSQWLTQLGALGLDPEAARSGEARAEAGKLAQLALPPLRLPPAPPPGLPARRALPALTVLLAVALLIWLRPREGGELRIKGDTKVSVFYERDGAAHERREGDVLRAGDRVRATVESAAGKTVFYELRDAAGHTLIERAAFASGAMPVSLRLDGAPAGETLVISICGPGETPPACETRNYKLR